jgi:hypothetical protein
VGRWSVLLFFACGCTFAPQGLTPVDDAGADDLAMPDTDGPLPDDLTSAQPDLLPGGLLTYSRAPLGAATTDLTAEGTGDWAHFGLLNANSVNRKNGVSASTIQASANTMLKQYSSYTPGFTWSDGTPTASATDTHTGSYVNGVGHGFTVLLPADGTQRTAHFYLNNYNSVAAFGASLQDGSAPSMSEMVTTGAADVDFRYTVTWRAATSTTLQVTWAISTDSGMGSVDLLAVTLE